MKKLLVLFIAVMSTVGCHSQVPTTQFQVALTWTLPASNASWSGCTASAPCAFAISRAAITGTTCPATTGTAYALIGTTPFTTPSAYTDTTTATGAAYCYIVQTQQVISGSIATSGPSNTALVTIPGILAPSAPTGTATPQTGTTASIKNPSVIMLTAKVIDLTKGR